MLSSRHDAGHCTHELPAAVVSCTRSGHSTRSIAGEGAGMELLIVGGYRERGNRSSRRM